VLANLPAQEVPVPFRRSILLLAVLAFVAACGPGAGASPGRVGPYPSTAPAESTTPSGEASPDASQTRTTLTVGLGYIPSVQFAQFYLADQAGYYDDAGLGVTLLKGHHS